MYGRVESKFTGKYMKKKVAELHELISIYEVQKDTKYIVQGCRVKL